MKPYFLTYHTPDEPYISMARRLVASIRKYYGEASWRCALMEGPGNGRDMFAEAMGELYYAFSERLDKGPVILIDADCYLVGPIILALEGTSMDWDIAAVDRGSVSNSYGSQRFLSTIVIFNNKRPNVCRKFWLEWAAEIYDFSINPRPEPKKCAKVRNEKFAETGWAQTWFADQAALNNVIERTANLHTLHLDRDVYAATLHKPGALIIHAKGVGKLT